MVPFISGCTRQWYVNVPASANIRLKLPELLIVELELLSSNCTLCDPQFDPPYPSPVHVSHVHVAVAPTAMLSVAGV
jgi:hypothetical protein